jgi:hypothetical protein
MSYRPDSRWGDDLDTDYMTVCAEEKREERRMARIRDEYQQYLDRAFGTLSAEVLSFDRWKVRTGK